MRTLASQPSADSVDKARNLMSGTCEPLDVLTEHSSVVKHRMQHVEVTAETADAATDMPDAVRETNGTSPENGTPRLHDSKARSVSRARRRCGTPGCTLEDFHPGLCTSQEPPTRKRQRVSISNDMTTSYAAAYVSYNKRQAAELPSLGAALSEHMEGVPIAIAPPPRVRAPCSYPLRLPPTSAAAETAAAAAAVSGLLARPPTQALTEAQAAATAEAEAAAAVAAREGAIATPNGTAGTAAAAAAAASTAEAEAEAVAAAEAEAMAVHHNASRLPLALWMRGGCVAAQADADAANTLLEYINRNRTALGGIHFPVEEDGERFSVGCSAARGSRAHAPESSTLLIGNKELLSAIRLVPGLEKLVRSVRTGAQSGLELLHAWVLSEVGDAVCHALRHDRLEEFDETGARDRVCERTVVVDLKGEGRAALQVVGCAPTRFARAPGAALAFDSSLWYRMCRPISAGDEVIKLILVFGALL